MSRGQRPARPVGRERLGAAVSAILLSAAPAATPVLGQELAVVSRGDDRVVIVDIATGELRATLPVGNFPHEIASRSGAARAYVPGYGGNQVHALDLASGSVESAWDLGPIGSLHGAALSTDGRLLWVTAEEERAVIELSTSSGEVIHSWPTSGYRSHMVVSTPDDAKLYVANIDDGSVSVIDRAGGAVTVIPTGAGAEGIDISPDGAEVWVSNRAAATVTIIDTGSDEVVARMPSAGDFPVKLRISPDGRWVVVANNRSGSIAVFDAAARTLSGSVEVGARPLGLAFSGDSRRVYVSRPGAGEVVEVDVAGLQVERRIPVGDGPDGLVWLP